VGLNERRRKEPEAEAERQVGVAEEAPMMI